MDQETVFLPRLDILPPAQRRLWEELRATPDHFTLYGGTALALRLGHRTSVDFDFFSNQGFDPDRLAGEIPYLRDAERVQVEANTLTCRIERGGPVLVSFFGGLGLGQVAPHGRTQDIGLGVASLLDLAGTKAAVVQKRAELKDYLDMDALLQTGTDLPTILAAGGVVYGRSFNPLITLKALSYFDDLPKLSDVEKKRLGSAVLSVDVTHLPVLAPYRARPGETGKAS
jgi:hypothetical protein